MSHIFIASYEDMTHNLPSAFYRIAVMCDGLYLKYTFHRKFRFKVASLVFPHGRKC